MATKQQIPLDSLVETLYLLSTALLIPVIVALLGFMAWALVEIGGFLREFRERRKREPAWRRLEAKLQQQPAQLSEATEVACFFDTTAYPGLLAAFAARGRERLGCDLYLEKLVSELEIEASGQLARMSLGVRVGPMLGLMGTLIPLGPAVVGLSDGQLEATARSLVVAFSTTVLGVFVGGACYGILLARRQWYARDLSNVEYVYRCLCARE